MGTNEFDLYLGMNNSLADQQHARLLQVVQNRYPDAQYGEILDGYWSGVEEATLLIKVVTTEKHLLETIELLKDIQPDIFVAFDDDNV